VDIARGLHEESRKNLHVRVHRSQAVSTTTKKFPRPDFGSGAGRNPRGSRGFAFTHFVTVTNQHALPLINEPIPIGECRSQISNPSLCSGGWDPPTSPKNQSSHSCSIHCCARSLYSTNQWKGIQEPHQGEIFPEHQKSSNLHHNQICQIQMMTLSEEIHRRICPDRQTPKEDQEEEARRVNHLLGDHLEDLQADCHLLHRRLPLLLQYHLLWEPLPSLQHPQQKRNPTSKNQRISLRQSSGISFDGSLSSTSRRTGKTLTMISRSYVFC
jgi:hypothetical protein